MNEPDDPVIVEPAPTQPEEVFSSGYQGVDRCDLPPESGLLKGLAPGDLDVLDELGQFVTGVPCPDCGDSG